MSSTVNITYARKHLDDLAKTVINSHEPIAVTCKDGEFVLLGKGDYEALQETLYVYSNRGLVENIESLKNSLDTDFVSGDQL